FEGYIVKLKHLSSQNPDNLESIEALIRDIKAQNVRNKSIIEEYEKELESKKNRKFQTRCIQIAKEILNEEPVVEYRPPFLNGLELDAFFQRYQIALEVQRAQHRESWPDVDTSVWDILARRIRELLLCPECHEPIFTNPQQKNITILTDRRMIHSVCLECPATKAEEKND
ncbi:19322_t:CDS:2, partial [Funneliformis geosporum]